MQNGDKDAEEAIASSKLAAEWLMNSGIQVTAPGENFGGFNSWFDTETRKYPYIYSEITGYGISTMLFLYRNTGNPECLRRAEMAADYIISKAIAKNGGLLTRSYYDKLREAHDSFESQLIFAFDTGMVLNGMSKLAMLSGKDRYRECSEKLASFLMETMQRNDGTFYAAYDGKTESPVDSAEKWSTQSGSFHAKLGVGLYNMSELTGEDKYLRAATRACNAALEFQQESGRFISFSDNRGTHMHPHCYTGEGLLFIGTKTGNMKYVEAARKATEWALGNQLEDGGIPSAYMHGKLDQNQRSDTLAQALRLGMLLKKMGQLDDSASQRMSRLKNRLIKFQYAGENTQKGGFQYGQENGRQFRHLNSWCTMFAVQGLYFYGSQRAEISPDLMI